MLTCGSRASPRVRARTNGYKTVDLVIDLRRAELTLPVPRAISVSPPIGSSHGPCPADKQVLLSQGPHTANLDVLSRRALRRSAPRIKRRRPYRGHTNCGGNQACELQPRRRSITRSTVL